MGSNCCKLKRGKTSGDKFNSNESLHGNKRKWKLRKQKYAMAGQNSTENNKTPLDKPMSKDSAKQDGFGSEKKNVRTKQLSLLTGAFAEANWVHESEFEKNIRRRRQMREALRTARTHMVLWASNVTYSTRAFVPDYISQLLRGLVVGMLRGNNVVIRGENYLQTSGEESTLAITSQNFASNKHKETSNWDSLLTISSVGHRSATIESAPSKKSKDCEEQTELEKLRAENAALRKTNEKLREKLWTTKDALAKFSELRIPAKGDDKRIKNVTKKFRVDKSNKHIPDSGSFEHKANKFFNQRRKSTSVRSCNNNVREGGIGEKSKRKYPAPVSDYRGVFQTKLFHAILEGELEKLPYEEIKFGYHNIRWPGIACSPASPIISYSD
ncbi:uncharacterized protein LOC120347926 isoform X1 [Styela clava]